MVFKEYSCREREKETTVPIRVQQMFDVGKYSEVGITEESPLTLRSSWELARIAAENGDAGKWVEKMFGVGRAGPKPIKGNIPKKSRFSSEKYVPLLDADFLISSKCCEVMKKKPAHKWQKENKMHFMFGTMADESLLRTAAWIKNGCNAFNGQNGGVSTPMAFWTEQDVLHYIVENNLKIAEVYGDIVPDEEHTQISMLHNYEGRLQCTGCSRTGCFACAFGAGHELLSKEGRYIRLARTHPKLYAYCMNGGAYDPEDGYWKPNKDGLGFAHVFDEINRLIPTKTGRPYIRYLPEGGEMERVRKLDEEKKKG